MALPDFLIIGAMKCGTSTLQAQLARQPGIFMSTPKEPNFFSDDEIYAKGASWYEALFDGASPNDLKGEASTHYTKLPSYPQTLSRLKQTIDEPKFIYLIRDPVARAVSHFVHEWTMGNVTEDIEAAFDAHPELVNCSRYAYQIEPYLQAFGRDAILLSTLEEMNRAPQAFLDRIGAFLGRQDRLVWQDEQAQMNASKDRIRRLPFHWLIFENSVATNLRRRLVPKTIRDKIRRSRQMGVRPTLSQERRRELEAVFAEDHAKLIAMFPDCTEISRAYSFLKQ